MSHSSPSPSPSSEYSAAGSLYCCEDVADLVSSGDETSISDHPTSWTTFVPPSDDETTIAELIESEPHHMPEPDYLQRISDRSIDVVARKNSIRWIFKVHAYFQFRPVTAYLSVNYLDRFLSCSSIPQPNSWAFHLLSVACLSLAAKMEEPRVPPFLELQMFEPGFLFDPNTLQRMELRVLNFLNWRLRSVTPFDYLKYFLSKIPESESITRFFTRASDLVLASTRFIEVLRFPPSTVAAAAVLCAAGEGRGDIMLDQLLLCFHDRVDREMVRSCHQLMLEHVADTCPKRHRVADVAPPLVSPSGVLDAATRESCVTRTPSVSQNFVGSAESRSSRAEDEPFKKRLRSSAPDVKKRP